MKGFVAFLCVAALSPGDGGSLRYEGGFSLPIGGEEFTDHWFEQKLDHFDDQNFDTWQQRYMVKNTFFEDPDSGPVFLYIGGEGPIWSESMMEGQPWIEYARSHRALCFQLEHRFYGKSQPTGDLSTESLKYLSSEQALADLANFIHDMNKHHNLSPSNKWVVIGGSYAGSLAAWARLKYPRLIHAAVASSAPLLAQIDFKGYNEVVREALTAWSPECAAIVHEEALAHEAPGLLNKIVIELLAIYAQDAVQRDDEFGFRVDSMCESLTGIFDTPAERYASVIKWLSDNLPLYANSGRSFVQRLSPLDSSRPWHYQTCTEFGWFHTSSSDQELFGTAFPWQGFVTECTKTFGHQFNYNRLVQGVDRTNRMYHHRNIVDHVDKIIFVQGSLDPWHVLGISHSDDPAIPVFLIEGASHCADMHQVQTGRIREYQIEINKKIGQFLETM